MWERFATLVTSSEKLWQAELQGQFWFAGHWKMTMLSIGLSEEVRCEKQ